MEDESDGVERFFIHVSPETVDSTIHDQGESAIESQGKIASMYTCRLIIISRVYNIIHVHGNVIICLAVFIPL